MINFRDDPGVFSQTQRRRRYPGQQQCARYNNVQSSHVPQKYRFGCVIPAKCLQLRSRRSCDWGSLLLGRIRHVT